MMTRNLSVLILLGFIWGSGYSIARYATTHGVSPLGYAFWQSLGPAILLLLFTARHWFKDMGMLLRFWPFYLISGVLGIFIPNTNMYFAAPHLPAGVVAVVVNIVPLLVYPLALLCRQERFDGLRMLGVLLGVIGILMVVSPENMLLTHFMTNWALMTLLTPFSFALCVIYIAKYRPAKLDSLVLSAGMLCASALLLTPFMRWTGEFYPLHFPLTRVSALILLEVLLSSVGYVLLFKLIKMAGPVYYSLVSGVVTLTGLFWGYIIFGESLTLLMSIAVVLILIAIFLVTIRRQKFINS